MESDGWVKDGCAWKRMRGGEVAVYVKRSPFSAGPWEVWFEVGAATPDDAMRAVDAAMRAAEAAARNTDASEASAPPDAAADPALADALRRAAATLRAAGLTADPATCVAMVPLLAGVERVEVAEEVGTPEGQRWPRWVEQDFWTRRLVPTADDADRDSACVARVTVDTPSFRWRAWRDTKSWTDIGSGEASTPAAAMDAAEAALRDAGVIGRDVRVWR